MMFQTRSMVVVLLGLFWIAPAKAIGIDVPAAPSAGEAKPPLPEIVAAVEAARGLRNAGNDAEALNALDKALTLARGAKDLTGEALTLNNIASIYRYQAGLNIITAGQQPSTDLIDKSAKLYQQALAVARAAGSKFNVGYAELYLGVLEAGRNDADKAFAHYERALVTFKEAENRYYLARTYLSMGATALYRRQQADAALKFYEQALPLFREAKIWGEALLVIQDMAVAYDKLMAEAKSKK